jgi:hypothetical protein
MQAGETGINMRYLQPIKTVMNTIQKCELSENGFLNCTICQPTLYYEPNKMTYLDQNLMILK